MAMRGGPVGAVLAASAMLLACSPASVPAVSAPAPPHVEAISGIVVDSEGRAVPGARVALVPLGLFDPSGARYPSVETATDGSFRLAGAASGRYGVTATAPGQGAASAACIGAGHAGLRLQLGGGGRHLSGRVVDRDGRPRGGAEIRLARGLGEAGEVFIVESAPDGRWSAIVPEGAYHANAVLPGHMAAPRYLPQARDSADLVLDSVWPAGPPPVPVVDWLRRNRIPISTVDPGHGFADLAPLLGVVGDARVVGLGEATHGTREIFRLKHRMLEYLVSELGFNVFAIEFGLPESFALDDYVMGGEGDPERMIAGQFVAVWQAEELLDLVRWMRGWNQAHDRKVRFHGLDMRMGVRAAQEAFAYLGRVDRTALESPAARALAPLADPVAYREALRAPAPELSALAAHAHDLAARFDARRADYAARSDGESWWRAAMHMRALAQLLEWRAAADTAGRVRVRERAMADNVMRILDHHGAEARAVVWAHNAHVFGNADAEPQMAGVHLRRRLGDGYRAFGSVLHHGAYQAADASNVLREFAVPPPASGSIEAALAAAGSPVAAFDLRALPETGVEAAWFNAYQPMRQFDGLYGDQPPEGWDPARTIAARDYDALLFVREGTVARRLPFARALYAGEPPPRPTAANLDLEEAKGTAPAAWLWSPERERVCGYAVALDRDRPFAGRASARIERTAEPRYGACAGQLRQTVDAAPYRGGKVRLRASVRVERAGEHAHLYLQAGARRATALASGNGWRVYDAVIEVPGDAQSLEIGFAFDGEGSAWLDAVSLTALPADT